MVRSHHKSSVSEGSSPPAAPSPKPKSKKKGKGTKRSAPKRLSEDGKRPFKKQKEGSLSPTAIKRTVAPPPRPSTTAAGPSMVLIPPPRQRRSEITTRAKPTIISEEEESSEEEGSDEDPDITMQDSSPRLQTPDPLDIVSQPQPPSPPSPSPLPTDDSLDLQGSSRTTGGFARGKAAGNAPNAADFPDIQESSTIIPIPSYIYFYFTPEDPAGMALTDLKVSYKASMSKHSSLQDIIQRIRIQYPEVDGMCFSLSPWFIF
jgi:hypothetical protein